ncbi:MAG: ATP-binding protein [Phycisphaeraceae bacterium]|nr:ATP-binding protein [Phycisphaeraceae bacterium]
MADTQHPMEIALLSRPDWLIVVRGAIDAAARKLGLAEEQTGKVVLAVDEALTNIIRHGYGNRDDQPIRIRLGDVQRNGRPGLEIVIEDQCPDVDLSRIRSRKLDDIRPGGLGVHILHEVMTDVLYEHRVECPGVRLTLRTFA